MCLSVSLLSHRLPEGDHKGYITFFLLLVIFVLVLLWLRTRQMKQQYHLKEAERVRELIRKQRHDWMNHIQVIMGYHMLQQREKMDRYLHRLIQVANEERKISDLPYPPLASLLLTIHYDYPQWSWFVKKDESMGSLSVKQQKKLFLMLERLLPWLKKQMTRQSAWTDITFDLSYQQGWVICSFHFNKTERMEKSIEPTKWEHVPKDLEQKRVTFQWDENDHLLTVHLPCN